MGYIWKFENVETQKKHEVSLGSCLFKTQLSFSKILAWTLEQVFIMVSFYSDAELIHKLGKKQNFHIMLEIVDYKESKAFTKFGFLQCP